MKDSFHLSPTPVSPGRLQATSICPGPAAVADTFTGAEGVEIAWQSTMTIRYSTLRNLFSALQLSCCFSVQRRLVCLSNQLKTSQTIRIHVPTSVLHKTYMWMVSLPGSLPQRMLSRSLSGFVHRHGNSAKKGWKQRRRTLQCSCFPHSSRRR
jgi:hypothetical protein